MNLVNMGNKILFLCVSLLAYVNSYAKVVLPAYFTDNMVLQQNTEVTFHGKAVLGKILKVTTGWNNEVYVTQVNKDGYWSLSVPTPAAGGPYTLTFTDEIAIKKCNGGRGMVLFWSV